MFGKASDYPRFIACKTVKQLNFDLLTYELIFHSQNEIDKKEKPNNPHNLF